MQLSSRSERKRWVVQCDPLTVASIKVLATSSKQSIGYTLDQAVLYFSRKVQFRKDQPLNWDLPDDF